MSLGEVVVVDALLLCDLTMSFFGVVVGVVFSTDVAAVLLVTVDCLEPSDPIVSLLLIVAEIDCLFSSLEATAVVA